MLSKALDKLIENVVLDEELTRALQAARNARVSMADESPRQDTR